MGGCWRRIGRMAVAGMLLLSGCAASDFSRPGPLARPAEYAGLFSPYAELCALSGMRKRPGSELELAGGPGGHSGLFLGGVCRVRDANYPVLEMCGPDRADPPDGTGISVNAHFRNANWVATEGSAFYFDGGLHPGQRLTRGAYRQAQTEAMQRGILDGVRFHDAVFDAQPPGMARRAFMYEESVATDYAIAFGRGRDCARLPLTRPQMARVVAYLNAQNARYRDGPAEFRWNVLRDNCAHLTHNALAAAGVWDPWATDAPWLVAAFAFPVPKNELVNLVRRADDPGRLGLMTAFNDPAARQALLRDDWLPSEPGVIASSAPVWPDNDVYATNTSLIFYDDPVFGPYRPAFERIRTEPRYHDLAANLKGFADAYARLRDARRPLAWWLARRPSLARGDFPLFYARFYAYLDRQDAFVAAALRRLSAPLRNP